MRWLIVGLVVLSVSCRQDWGFTGDIWSIGGPEEITQDTLQQRERFEIMRRIGALTLIAARVPVAFVPVGGTTPSVAEQQGAEAGLLKIHERLLRDDWEIFNSHDFAPDVQRVNDPAEHRAFLVKNLYYDCRTMRVREDFYRQLRPPEDRPDLLRVWQNPTVND
jgi:hypothetical protein